MYVGSFFESDFIYHKFQTLSDNQEYYDRYNQVDFPYQLEKSLDYTNYAPETYHPSDNYVSYTHHYEDISNKQSSFTTDVSTEKKSNHITYLHFTIVFTTYILLFCKQLSGPPLVQVQLNLSIFKKAFIICLNINFQFFPNNLRKVN